MMKPTLFRASAALAATLLLAGCASGADARPSGDPDALEKTAITVGSVPIVDYAALYWADEKGFFAKEGLTVAITPVQGGAVGVQKVVSGELDFANSSPIAETIVAAKGAPLTTVALTSWSGPGSLAVFVKPDSPIRSLRDLHGKTIGINTTNSVADVSLANLAASEKLTVEPKWVEVPFSEMIAGVQAGSIQAGYLPEPFASAARAAGLRQVADLTTGPNAAHPGGAIFVASDAFAKQNPNTVRAFARALYAAGADIAGDEKAFREWMPSIAQLSPEVAASMVLPEFQTKMDVAKLQAVADLLKKQGRITGFDAAAHTVEVG